MWVEVCLSRRRRIQAEEGAVKRERIVRQQRVLVVKGQEMTQRKYSVHHGIGPTGRDGAGGPRYGLEVVFPRYGAHDKAIWGRNG